MCPRTTGPVSYTHLDVYQRQTLDPMATGVLPVFVGQATRAVSFAEDGQKEYVAGLRLGRTTDTQDTSGETLDTHPVLTGREDLEHLLPRFTGSIEQVPPMYSAIKIGGQKLYQIARRGGEVERPARPVTIHELEPVSYTHLVCPRPRWWTPARPRP